jgi:hypothetical protein
MTNWVEEETVENAVAGSNVSYQFTACFNLH